MRDNAGALLLDAGCNRLEQERGGAQGSQGGRLRSMVRMQHHDQRFG
jgi:hypothetical protein